MRAWRIAIDTREYAADDCSGTGAKLTGGRWNRAGLAVLYCASTPSLACLETLVHLGTGSLPLNRYLVAIDIPDAIWARREIHTAATLPAGWDSLPAGNVSLDLGDAWIKGGRTSVLAVPSIVVPEEHVVLINPRHRESRGLTATKIRKWSYDPRLL